MKLFNVICLSAMVFILFSGGASAENVTITPYVTQVNNWNFETWTDSTHPANWSTSTDGGARSSTAELGNYSYYIHATGTDAGISQAMSVYPGVYYATMGAWVKAENVEAGTLNIDIKTKEFGTTKSYITVSGNQGWTPIILTKSIYAGSTGAPLVRVYTSGSAIGDFYVDGVFFANETSSISATEVDDGLGVYQEFQYTPTSVYPKSALITQFMYYDIESRGTLYPAATIDGVPVSSWQAGDYVYIDTSGLSAATHSISVRLDYNAPPTMITPANGSTITFNYPPLYDDITFEWEDVNSTCQIQIATDTTFTNVVYTETTTDDTTTCSLAAGTYYWRVRRYDPVNNVYGAWPNSYSVILVSNTGSVSGTGVMGTVYWTSSLGHYSYIPGATVTVYNDTYTVQKTTGESGYFQALGLTNTTYYITVSADGYDTTSPSAVTVTNNNVSVFDISMQKEQTYFQPHYVKFIVTDTLLHARYYATINVYIGDNTISIASLQTGDDGSATINLDEDTTYRIETSYLTYKQIDKLMPSESMYYIIIDGDAVNTPANMYDYVNVSVTNSAINATAAYINVTYTDLNETMTNSVNVTLGQHDTNGTFVPITIITFNETDVTTNQGNVTASFIVTNYKGQSYTERIIIDHDALGVITKWHVDTFNGSSLPFGGKIFAYFGIFILFIVAMQFGRADHATGAILLCGMFWFLYFVDVFEGFGEAVTTTMFSGGSLATIYAIMVYINEKRREEGI